MMEVICINNNNREDNLTLNKLYETVREEGKFYCIVDDKGNVNGFYKTKFKEPDDSLTIDERFAKECNSFEEYLNKITEYYKSLDVHIWGSEDGCVKREKDINFGRIMAYIGVLEQYNRFKEKEGGNNDM